MTLQYSNVYTVKNGDTLSTIARDYNTTIDKLMFSNMLSSTILTLGQKLYIPITNHIDQVQDMNNVNQQQYRPVIAYTATRPIIVNGIII